MYKIKANIHLYLEKEGGSTRTGFSGMQPSIDIGGDLIACKIIYGNHGAEMPLGQDYDVAVELPYGEVYADRLKSGFHFNLNIAGRVIGYGTVE